jgi:hypothetical protein
VVKRGGPLKRRKGLKRTPLARGTSKLKRKRLNRISKDERKRIRDRTPEREKYKREHPVCECERDCGEPSSQLHEMAAGAQFRWKSAALPSCWLCLSERCHRRLQGVNYVVQLGCKLYHDPENYNHAEFHEVIGRKTAAHPIAEVIAAMPRKPPSLDECKLDYDHWHCKMTLLSRQLAEARQKFEHAKDNYFKAQQRAAAVAAAENAKG